MACFMIKQKDNSAMFLFLLLLFLDPTPTRAWVRTDCPEGKILWQQDQLCYRPFYQGPCDKGQILIDHPQGPICEHKNLADVDVKRKVKILFPDEDNWRLPDEGGVDDLSVHQSECLARGQVYWPPTRSCYQLLSQGPCGESQWLVLDIAGPAPAVVCRARVCPCDPAMPDLCEVEINPEDRQETGGCQCKVALAAAQDGICQPGQQLLVGPTGYGECGCIQNPVHVTMGDNHTCHPLYHQGPCSPGYMVTWSELSDEAVCRPALCGEGAVKWEDGKCHKLGEQGPCDPDHYLSVSPGSVEPLCVLPKIKRVWDMIPTNIGLIKNGPLSHTMKIRSARRSFSANPSRRRRTQSRHVQLFVKRSDPRKYLGWLNSFRKPSIRQPRK